MIQIPGVRQQRRIRGRCTVGESINGIPEGIRNRDPLFIVTETQTLSLIQRAFLAARYLKQSANNEILRIAGKQRVAFCGLVFPAPLMKPKGVLNKRETCLFAPRLEPSLLI